MRRVIPLALALTAMACHRSGWRSEAHQNRKLGDYSFRVNMSSRDPVDGAFTIAADSVLLEIGGQACRRDFTKTTAADLNFFSCFPPAGFDKFDVTIDSAHPFSSSWGMTQSVMKTRTVCVRTAVDSRGRQYCAENRTENYFVDVRSGGRIRITAADTARH